MQAHYLVHGCWTGPEDWQALALPVLFLNGARDAVCRPAPARAVQQALAGSAFVTVETGHGSAPEALIDAVRTVAAGRRYLDAQLARRLALAHIEGEASPSDVLTEREFAVFLQLAQGQSVAEIA